MLVDHNGNPFPSTNGNGTGLAAKPLSPGLAPPLNPFAQQLADPGSLAFGGGPTAQRMGVQALPHVITFGSVWNAANKVYSWRWDEAYKNSRADALSMRRDGFLMSILQERCLAVSNLNWHLEPEDGRDKRQKATADYLTKIIQRQRKLPTMFYNLMDAVWYGRYGAAMSFDWVSMERPNGIPGPEKSLVPTSYYPVNGDKIQFRYQLPQHSDFVNGNRLSEDAKTSNDAEWKEDYPVIRIHTGYASTIPKAQLVLTDMGQAIKLDTSYWRERFIIHEHIPDDADFFEAEMAGGVHGVGVRSRLYWLDWIRKEWLSNVMDYIQRVGQGVVIFYYESGNPESEAQAIRAANNMSSNAVIVWPRPIGGEKQGAGVERFDMPLTGSETLIKLMEWIQGIEERYIIGQSASSKSDAQGMGTHDNSAQMDTKYRIVKFDATNLADSLTHDYVKVLQRWNCPQEKYQIRFVFDVDKPDAEKAMQALDKAWSFGVPLRTEDIYSTTGTSKPDEGDDVVENPQIKQQQMQLEQQAQQMQQPDQADLAGAESLLAGGMEIGGGEQPGGGQGDEAQQLASMIDSEIDQNDEDFGPLLQLVGVSSIEELL